MNTNTAVNYSRGLKDKVAIVTGGLGDIGGAITRKLAGFGAQVILFDLLEESAGAVRARELGGAAYRMVDQGNPDQLQAAIAEAAKKFARIDVIIGNAALGSGGNLLDLTASDWDTALRVNLVGCAMLAKAAVKRMLEQMPDSEGIRGKVS